MNHSSDLPDGLDIVAERLRANRAELTPLELDAIKQQTRARAGGRTRTHSKRGEQAIMRSRSSIVAVLASGALLSSGGVAMGVSGLAAGNSAAGAQYGQVLGTHAQGSQGTQGSQGSPAKNQQQVLGATQSSPAIAQPTRQQAVENSGQSLPFTGYAAIPVLLLGLGLLGTGVLMRRRSLGDRRS